MVVTSLGALRVRRVVDPSAASGGWVDLVGSWPGGVGPTVLASLLRP
ncbi:hypothetical protein HMPREF0063_10381 [Aeromicrobium marinum DSM 15272]|uniref:Uncharacterized protein n=1 Tax=Aeromicrobium marinum DSM 15272 TaxID=585531 RepID=E2S8M4_9ACTN|nr:hypothetical protein HMPREF0063_10381 [Aeromicrobium marinum DSM 15272]